MIAGLSIPIPQQKRSRQTAGLFVAAALELLKDRTFAELSVAEIAAAAKRSVGAFYQRFGSKDDFLETLLTDFFRRACRISRFAREGGFGQRHARADPFGELCRADGQPQSLARGAATVGGAARFLAALRASAPGGRGTEPRRDRALGRAPACRGGAQPARPCKASLQQRDQQPGHQRTRTARP